MSALQVTAQRHSLIQKGRASFHAAIPAEDGWKTACGETLRSELHRTIRTIDTPLDELVVNAPALICKRCDRVGSVLL